MNTPRVVLIDDGINADYVPRGISFESYEISRDGIKVAVSPNDFTHGTACYQMFRDNVRVKYHLISIKVLEMESGVGAKESLIIALDWCLNNEIDLINMSMGTSQYLDFECISEAIRGLSKTVIVAACNNRNTITFPSCLPTVIGVRHCDINSLKGKFVYKTQPYDQIEVMTYTEGYSNSMAAPVITARVCNYLASGFNGLVRIREQLKEDSAKDSLLLGYNFYKNLILDWEDVQVPVVSLTDDAFNMPNMVDKLKSLMLYFIERGCRPICFSKREKTDIEALLFQIKWSGERVSLPELIRLYYNFTYPDIIFLHMNANETYNLEEPKPDIVITEDMFKKNIEMLYKEIKTLLS